MRDTTSTRADHQEGGTMCTPMTLSPPRAALTTTRPVPRRRPWLLAVVALALGLLLAPAAAGAEGTEVIQGDGFGCNVVTSVSPFAIENTQDTLEVRQADGSIIFTCKIKGGVDNTTGTAYRLTGEGTGISYSYHSWLSYHSVLPSLDWHVNVSASGNATLVIKYLPAP